MINMKDWLSQDETAKKIKRTVSFIGYDGKKNDIEVDVIILNGIDKEEIEDIMYSEDNQGKSATVYKREMVRRSLGLSHQEVDQLYRKKPASAVEAFEDLCLEINTSKYTLLKERRGELKNLDEMVLPDDDLQ